MTGIASEVWEAICQEAAFKITHVSLPKPVLLGTWMRRHPLRKQTGKQLADVSGPATSPI